MRPLPQGSETGASRQSGGDPAAGAEGEGRRDPLPGERTAVGRRGRVGRRPGIVRMAVDSTLDQFALHAERDRRGGAGRRLQSHRRQDAGRQGGRKTVRRRTHPHGEEFRRGGEAERRDAGRDARAFGVFGQRHDGARDSVSEGEVHVDSAGKAQALRAGDQTTTHASIERVPVREEIAWSRDAGRYIRMLDAIRNQIDQQLAMPGNRFSTRLLDLVPGDTVLYVAIPNIGETLARANEILQENLQKNDELRGWWEQEQKESNKPGGRRQGLNQAIELMREFGSQLGDEIVISAAANPRGSGEPEAPVLLAEVKDGGAFRSFLEGQLDKLGSERKHARIVDDPMNIASEGKDEFFIWIAGDLIAVSPRPEQLQSLAMRMRQGAKPFASTSFYAQIANLYRDGAGLVIAAASFSLRSDCMTIRSRSA